MQTQKRKLKLVLKKPNNKKRMKLKFKQGKKEKYANVFKYMESRNFSLYPYQKEGVEWMISLEKGRTASGKKDQVRGGLLGDEPGLGKTVQTCALMYGNPKRKTLIVVPGAVIHQWVETIEKVLPNLRIYIHRGNNRARTYGELCGKCFDVAITTLDLMYKRKQDVNFLTVLHTMHWDRIVIDEIHYIRNSSSKKARGCHSLKATHKWGLTGTPIQNSIKDLKSLYKFVGLPSMYMTNEGLKEANLIYMKRRTKKMVEKFNKKLRIPNLIQKTHVVGFSSKKEKDIYRRVKDDVKSEYLELIESDMIEQNQKMLLMFELLLRLRQVSIHPQIVINGFSRKYQRKYKKYNGKSSKIEAMLSIVKDKIEHENCLVFCHFREEMDIIQERLANEGIGCMRYDGSMSLEQRNKSINSFSDIKGRETLFREKGINSDLDKEIEKFLPKVLLIQINAGGVGINLQMFSQVFIISPNWNPSNEIQAIARAHRIGQKREVTVHRFTLFDTEEEFSTIDQRIVNIQVSKRSIMAEYLKDETFNDMGDINTSLISSKKFKFKLSRTDFRNLLS